MADLIFILCTYHRMIPAFDQLLILGIFPVILYFFID